MLMSYLGEAFGEALSPEGAKAWRNFLDTLISVVGSELQRLDKPVTACSGCTVS